VGSESAFAGSDSAASAGGEAAAATAAAAVARATPLVRRTAEGGGLRGSRRRGGGGRRGGEGASAATSRRDAMRRDGPGLREVGVHRTRAPRVAEDYSPGGPACLSTSVSVCVRSLVEYSTTDHVYFLLKKQVAMCINGTTKLGPTRRMT
jgi:hypothetical protein